MILPLNRPELSTTSQQPESFTMCRSTVSKLQLFPLRAAISRRAVARKSVARMVLLLLLAAGVHSGLAQTISANLSGFVNDPTGAVIPNAQVTLTNQNSKDRRSARSNRSGYFSFNSIPAATYSVEIKSPGFETFVERDIVLNPSDDRTLIDIKLLVGNVDVVVTVDSASATILNQGEKSVVITAEDIKRLPTQGRDVTELIKTLPGFAMTAQGSGADNLGPNTTTVGGQTGSYTANGVSPEGIQIVVDGVNITDPGNGAGSDQVVNMDNVAEVKIQTSNFGADSAKGPIVINAVGKSGGSEYHGELYVHGRTYQLDTQDWFSKYDNDAKPLDREIYPGGNIGGPLLIPGTSFNHNRKLTFFAGAEDYIQRNIYSYGSASSATVNALVPTAAMRGGDFTAASLANYFGPTSGGAVGGQLANCNQNTGNNFAQYINICNVPSGTYTNGSGQIIPQFFDPGTQAMLKLVPLPNTTPQLSSVGGLFNYKQVNLQDNDGFQARVRVDYAFSDTAKLYVTYSFQHGTGRNPQQVFYSPQDNFGEINTPGGILSHGNSHVASLNFTRVLNASTTNELYAGSTLILSGNKQGIANSNLTSYNGYPYQGIAGFNTHNQYPQLYDYGFDGLPLALFPDYSSAIFQNKFVPNGGDNLTKVVKTHTLKFGVYLERTENNQTDLNGASNGQLENYYDGPNNAQGTIQGTYSCTNCGTKNGTSWQYSTPGNYLASFMIGEISAFQQQSLQTNSDLFYWTVDLYATDSWKASRKLTLDYGFRVGHVGPWNDAHKLGMAVWDPGLYSAQLLNPTLYPNPGYTWHAQNQTVPLSGTGSTFAFFSPRFGLAYDMYGNGKTFFRGGIGAYRSHDGWNDVNQEQATSQGQVTGIVGGGGIMLKDVPYLGVENANGSGTNTTNGFGLSMNDHEQPLTWTYSFTVDQQLNNSTIFEIGYQGNQASHLLTQYEQGASGDLENINALPIGALFKPDPITGVVDSPSDINNNNRTQDYRPYHYYSQVNVAKHILYSNYNGLQVSLRKTQGRFLYSFNYTWSKNLGVLGSYGTGNVIDSTNIRPNYGPLASDRSSVTNDTVSYQTGSWYHGERLVRGLLNGYEISAIMNLQSGANIQRVLGSNLGLGSATSASSISINNINLLGTPDVVLQPRLTCNPHSNLTKPHQYLNSACFALPTYGVNGPAEFPYIHAPAYFDLDARIGKSYKLRDRRSFDMQLSAFNVINRPNYSFSSKFPLEQTLTFTGGAPPTALGQALFRFGRRVTEISLKYNF